MRTKKVAIKGYVGEFTVQDYLEYAKKTGEILPIELGNRVLYKMYLNNLSRSKSEALLTNHKSSLDSLLASYGQETLVNLNGKQVRRLQLNIEKVPYKELQDQLVGDFVFYYPKINQLIIVDNIHYDSKNPNLHSTANIQRKLHKLRNRNFMYKVMAKEILELNCNYISILWNSNSSKDLLEEIVHWHEQNKYLRKFYTKMKKAGENVNSILTQIHVKTNIDLSLLEFDITEGFYK